ncbi:MAG: hypothetical protein FJ194_11725 [Gammaproteobacteria bacterium]|nr:hypothetical protein [Gammaproteobacteria bacterium]
MIAILGSLIAIYFQMRQSHAQERANAQRDLLNQSREWWLLGVESEQTFDLICAGLQKFSGLGRYQQARFHALAANLLQVVTGAHFQHRDKLINSSSQEGFIRAFLAILNTPGGREWWQLSSKVGNQELATYLRTLLVAEAGTLPP